MKKLYDDLVEQIILGILLNNNNYYDKIVDLIYPTDFFHETHQKIFITLENLIQKNQLANAVIVSNYTPEVESEYICNLAKDFIPPDNLLDYIRVLKELSQKRKLYNISDYIEKHLHNIDIKEQIEKIEQLIYNIHLKDEKTTVKFYEGTKQIIEYIKDIQEEDHRH